MNQPNAVQDPKSQRVAELEGRYLTFWTDGQMFGIPIADVVQIVGMQTVIAIPEFPPYAKGIIHLRGSNIPVIDVRLRLGKEEIPYNERTCVIVTAMNQKQIGLIVDEVDEVADIPDTQVSPPPKLGQESGGAFLTGVAQLEGYVVLLLDSARMINPDQLGVMLDHSGL